MHDVASIIAFKRKQIASLAEIGTEPAAVASKRLADEVAALEAQPAEPVAVEPPAAPAPAGAVPSELLARIAQLADSVQTLADRVAVLEVLAAPQT